MKTLIAGWVILFTAQTIFAKTIPEIPAPIKSDHLCEYGGRTFHDGDDLPTRHLCLSCKCSKDFVEPNDINCEVLQCPQTNHLELGCVPTYNDTECCPVSWQCDRHDTSKCDKRYFKHYQVKRCIPVHKDGSDCPVWFDCPPADSLPHYENECEFQGRLYKDGDSIDIGNPCQICSCRRGWTEKMDISCISVECPAIFRPPLNESCYEVFESGRCCAVRTECRDPNEAEARTEKTCEYGGKNYRLGEKIYPEEDPCLICNCNENWTGIFGNSCRVHDCSLERKRKQIEEGCLPIYHEGACCPIEFYCGSKEEGFKNSTEPLANSGDIEEGSMCVFKGVHYRLGQLLDINHPTHCVTCACSTPPDFTCIHKQCPGPPNDDYLNCSPSYTPGQCCATYTCKKQSAPAAPVCSPVLCPEGCQTVTVHNSCPFCQCEEKLCAPPKCAPGCHLQTDSEKGKCPECQCPDAIKAALSCSPVNCPPQCHEVVGSLGCPMCVCGPLCSPPHCGPGCHLQRDVGLGECPGCVCEASDQTTSPGSVQCAPVRCPATCRESVGESGCPSCVCDPLCSPPKCDPGCHLDTAPVVPGKCPGCICGDQEAVAVKQCAPVKCGPLCHEAFDGTSCPTCICDPVCSPPVCNEGCRLEHDPANGPCPTCVCNALSIDECPKVKCGPECHERIGAFGCPTCFCGPVCTPPKCEAGCHLEYDQSAGPCPACVCLQPRSRASGPTRAAAPVPEVACTPVRCDPGCVEALVQGGCPQCVCMPQCSAPVCESPCSLQLNHDSGPCPVCSCAVSGDNYEVMCSVPRCEADCVVDYSAKPCPSCTCGVESGVQCSAPNCQDGCRIDYSSHPCPSCNCDSNSNIPAIHCSMPKCEPGCRIDYNAKPCPSCTCGSQWISGVLCSSPKCNAGCHIDYDSRPCPACVCTGSETSADLDRIMCSAPKCDSGCHINYSSKPCPSCVCSGSTVPDILCSPPLCDAGCRIDYDARPCPSCSCGGTLTGVPDILCSPPACGEGCRVDYSTKPCPSCSCDNAQDRGGPLCATPKCAVGCRLNNNAKPCPACECTGAATINPACSTPKCDAGCRVDLSTKPCPSCSCPNRGPLCTPPQCGPGCRLNHDTQPCPTCECTGEATINAACSTPKCDAGCRVDLSTKPCPSCSCPNRAPTGPLCTPPQCGQGCRLNPNSKPCPTCECTGAATIDPSCSVPKCDDGCRLEMSSKPCPTCDCPGKENPIQCSVPKCEPGCFLDSSPAPCPSCYCPDKSLFDSVQCTPPKCDPGCHIDYSTEPCPTCSCSDHGSTGIQCAPPSCDIDCEVVTGGNGCPTCDCPRRKPVCGVPMCGPGCRIDYNADPCPSCVCDRFQRRYATSQLNVFRDPYCDLLKCGPGCERAAAPSGPTERCPLCICGGRGERLKCIAMQCELPCRWQRFTEHGCPSCVCFAGPSSNPVLL